MSFPHLFTPTQVGPGPVEQTRAFIPEVALYLDPIRSLFDKQAVLKVGLHSTGSSMGVTEDG